MENVARARTFGKYSEWEYLKKHGMGRGANEGNVIALIGDGSLTGGLIYEAINNAGRMSDARLIIVLNDNGMSISKNVGNLAKRLAVMRSTKEYFKFKSLAERIISKIPFIGFKLADKILKTKRYLGNRTDGLARFRRNERRRNER